jgi:Bacterial SH3 domain
MVARTLEQLADDLTADDASRVREAPRAPARTRLAAGLAAVAILVAGVLFGLHWLDVRGEDAQFKAAQNDIDRLDTYLRTCRQCQFRADAEAQLAQLYAAEIASAGFDRVKLERLQTICGLSCPGDMRREARTRLDALDAEKAQYKTAEGDIARLEAFVRDCKFCELRDDALRRLARLYAESLGSASFNRGRLKAFLSLCILHCSADLRREAQTRLDALDAETAQYRTSEDDIVRLQDYINGCRGCERKADAERRLMQLYAGAVVTAALDRTKLNGLLSICGVNCPAELQREIQKRRNILDAEKAQYQAAQNDIAQLDAYAHDCRGCEFKADAQRLITKLRKATDPLVPPPDPEDEYQKAVRQDTIEGYETFLQYFPNHPKSPAIRTLIERKQEEALWKEAEQAPSDERRRLCDRLLILYPQGVYAERARQCLAPLAADSQPRESDSCYFVTGVESNRRNWPALRAGPSFQARSATRMSPGTRLTLLERRGEWMYVRLQGGETGWANSKFTESCRNSSPPEISN